MRLNVLFFIKISLVTFFLCISDAVIPNNMDQNNTLEQVEVLSDAELNLVLQEANRIAQENQITEEEIDQTIQNVEAMLNEIDRQDPRPFGDFHKAVLFEIPVTNPRRWEDDRWIPGERNNILGEEREIRYVIQITGNDLLRLAFIAARCGIDALFFKILKKYFLKGIMNDIDNKSEKIIDSLICVDRYEDGEFIWNDSSKKALENSFTDAFSPDDITTKKIFLLLGLYLIASEIRRTAEQKTINIPWSGFIDFISRSMNSYHENNLNGRSVIPLPSIILNLIDSGILGGETLIENHINVIRNLILQHAGLHHHSFDSYWFELAKRSLVFSNFLRQTKSYFLLQSKIWVHEHNNELCALISVFYKAKIEGDIDLQQKINAKLKVFITKAYDYSFFQWLRFKGKCHFWTTILIEFLITMPALIKIGYEHV